MASELPEAPRQLPPEVAQLAAERALRSQRKYSLRWNKADQADENRWTRHDEQRHGMPYGICTVCEYLDGRGNAHDRRP